MGTLFATKLESVQDRLYRGASLNDQAELLTTPDPEKETEAKEADASTTVDVPDGLSTSCV